MKYTVRFVEWNSYVAGPVKANSPEEAQAVVEQAMYDGTCDLHLVVKDNGFER